MHHLIHCMVYMAYMYVESVLYTSVYVHTYTRLKAACWLLFPSGNKSVT